MRAASGHPASQKRDTSGRIGLCLVRQDPEGATLRGAGSGGNPTAYAAAMQIISRRAFFCSGAIGGMASARAASTRECRYRLATADSDIEMGVQFYDRYSSRGFWFEDRLAGRSFCLSGQGAEARGCLENFAGSLAVARYRVRPQSGAPQMTILREHVRTIDQDARIEKRPPFDREIRLVQGIASDIQAFGYETAAPSTPARSGPDPWCFFRQDLYFDRQPSPFLVVHWRHALSGIRVLDVIPGEHTWFIKS